MRPQIAALLVGAALLMAQPAAAEPNWTAVAQALGKTGSVQPGGIYKVALPRTDLRVILDGVPLKAAFALGSWVAFEPTPGRGVG